LAVKIRLMRVGKKKQPTYRLVVADSRSPRDGRFIEIIGQYRPRQEPSVVSIDNDRALHWLSNGAQPTEQAAKILEISGVWDAYKESTGKVAAAKPKAKTPKAKKPKEQPRAEAPAPAAGEPAADDSASAEPAAEEPAAEES
jgi:small subunit ribosomal protein S16